MKKIVALLMILCSLFLWGCGKDNATQSANKDEALKIEMLDIGQGDATLIQTKEQTIMIDTGDIDERDNLVKLLKQRNITTIDKLIITHPHADHLGGAYAVFKNFEVKEVYDNGDPTTTQTYKTYLKNIKEKKIKYQQLSANDELDFGIVIISNASPSLQLLPMSTNQVVACVPEDSPLAQKDSLSWSDVSNIDLIMLKEGSFIRNLIQQKLKEHNIQPNIILESNQIETIKGLISSNVGMAFLLDFVVQDTPHIKTLPIEDPIFVDVGLAWKKDRYISKAAQSFINFCQDTLNK